MRWEPGQGDLFNHGFQPVSYEIQFSESRKKFRLNCSGKEPNLHPFYPTAIAMLIDLKTKFENEVSNPKE